MAEKRPAGQALPNGLEMAAWLGSDFALRALRSAGEGAVADAIEHQSGRSHDWPAWHDSVPELYYAVLRSLFDKPDPAAPAFMKSEAWQRKSVQTALAGWAQLRHAWELQAKLTVSSPSLPGRPAGFVEPNPEFFRRLYILAEATVGRLQKAGVFRDTAADQADFFRDAIRDIDRLGLAKVGVAPDGLLPWHASERIYEYAWIAHQIDPTIPVFTRGNPATQQAAEWSRVRQVFRARIDALENGERVAPIDSLLMRDDPDRMLLQRWQLLLEMSAQFEAMVQKELRGADWNRAEAGLLTGYKERLGEVMGYVSSAAMFPKDDAPRWTTVYHNASSDRQLAIAIGRPRALYVLYPWKGKQVLCCGAVMPYYEYPSEHRLTDAEWRDLLDTGHAPPQPAWIRPLVSVSAPPR